MCNVRNIDRNHNNRFFITNMREEIAWLSENKSLIFSYPDPIFLLRYKAGEMMESQGGKWEGDRR